MNTPDIEIYIKNISIEQLTHWLESTFIDLDLIIKDSDLSQDTSIRGSVKPTGNHKITIPFIVTPKAAGKAFTSIWFQSPDTGWENDEAAAESYIKLFDSEVRCSASGWQESEEENSEQWWKITREEKKLINW